jgi:hypothetical protein
MPTMLHALNLSLVVKYNIQYRTFQFPLEFESIGTRHEPCPVMSVPTGRRGAMADGVP